MSDKLVQELIPVVAGVDICLSILVLIVILKMYLIEKKASFSDI